MEIEIVKESIRYAAICLLVLMIIGWVLFR